MLTSCLLRGRVFVWDIEHPWPRDSSILGSLADTHNNSRQRTELLVLITPHVIGDKTKVHRLSEDIARRAGELGRGAGCSGCRGTVRFTRSVRRCQYIALSHCHFPDIVGRSPLR